VKPEILGQYFGQSADGVRHSVGNTYVEWPKDECIGVLIAIARVAEKMGLDENGRAKQKTVHS
jgi:hypothetical protein